MYVRDIIVRTFFKRGKGWVGKKTYLTNGSTNYSQSTGRVHQKRDDASREARDLTWSRFRG